MTINVPITQIFAELTIPEFGNTPQMKLDISKIKQGEARLIEAKVVNGATYTELEFSFNEGYRQARQHITTLGYHILMAEKAIRQVKKVYILDEYLSFLKDKKLKDSVAIRECFLETKDDYVKAMDRLALLKAMESLMEGKIKVFENVCRYMRKSIDIQNRSGMNGNKYI